MPTKQANIDTIVQNLTDDQLLQSLRTIIKNKESKIKILKSLEADKIKDIIDMHKNNTSLPNNPIAVIPQQSVVNTPVAKTGKGNSKKSYMEEHVFPIGFKFDLNRSKFEITKYKAMTSDAILYEGKCIESSSNPSYVDKEVFVKVQPRHKKTVFQVTSESNTINQLTKNGCSKYIQKELAYGCYNESVYILVSPLYGSDLQDVEDISIIKPLAYKICEALKSIHLCGFYHYDIKQANIVFKNRTNQNDVLLIDFGTSGSIFDRNGNRKEKPSGIEGTNIYMSTMQHNGKTEPFYLIMSDIQCLAWTLLDMIDGCPWRRLLGMNHKDMFERICSDKEQYIANYRRHGALGELAKYTIDHKKEEFDTIKKESDIEQNRAYIDKTYKDIYKILDKLS